MKKIRIAQIGVGHDHAAETMESLRRLDEFEVIGIAEPNRQWEEKLASENVYQGLPKFSVEQLLANDAVDAVAIECEEQRATHYAEIFAKRGIHVHLDKPGTQDLAEFQSLIRTVKERGIVFQMGYMYRYNPMVMQALDILRSGELGEIYSVEAHMSTQHSKKKQEWMKNFKGGMMYFLGCHDIDLILQCMGGAPDEVICVNAPSGQYGVDSEDYGFAVLKYKGRASFVKVCSAEYNGFSRRQLVICGTNGTLEIRPIEEAVISADVPHMRTARARIASRLRTPDAKGIADRSVPLTCEDFQRYDGMMRAFAAYIRGETENPYTPDYESMLFETVMKCCGYAQEKGENT